MKSRKHTLGWATDAGGGVKTKREEVGLEHCE